MSHLSNLEAVQCVDHMYEFLFGNENYKRWCSLKETLNVPLESSFVSYVLDVVELHRDAMSLQENGAFFSKGCDEDSDTSVVGDYDGGQQLDGPQLVGGVTTTLLSAITPTLPTAVVTAATAATVAADTIPSIHNNVLMAPPVPLSDSDGEQSLSQLTSLPLPPSHLLPAFSSPTLNYSGLPTIFEERAIEHVDLNDSNDAYSEANFKNLCEPNGKLLTSMWIPNNANNLLLGVPATNTVAPSLPNVDERATGMNYQHHQQQQEPCREVVIDLAFPPHGKDTQCGSTSTAGLARHSSSIVSTIAAPTVAGMGEGATEVPPASNQDKPTVFTTRITQSTAVSSAQVRVLPPFPSQVLTSIKQQLSGADITGRGGNWCPICQKCMRNRSYLKTHLNTVHFGQKPHQCEYCHARFTRISTFKQHVRAVHLHVKPHKCDHCEQTFAKASNLTSHVKSVHLSRRKHMCTVCGLAFPNKKKRLDHEKRHT